jgi:hypothetical protein
MNKITEFLATCDIATLTPEGWVIVDVRDITDFERNVEKVKYKILLVTRLISMGAKVCVRCACGINRSNTIALSTLCYLLTKDKYLDTDWDRHYNFIKAKIPVMALVPELVVTAKTALKELYAGWK